MRLNFIEYKLSIPMAGETRRRYYLCFLGKAVYIGTELDWIS
jgi:hypothetical protein